MIQRLICLLLLMTTIACRPDRDASDGSAATSELRIMSYNILYPSSQEATLKVIHESKADVIGLQEISRERLSDLASDLDFSFHAFPKTTANGSDQDTGILSRYPIVRTLTNGVVVRIRDSLEVAVFTVHLSPYPYEPYDFRDGKLSSAEEAVASAAALRLPEIVPVLEEMESLKKDEMPVFLTGDFNEPSHLDWTPATSLRGLHFGTVVEWPVSKAITDAGLRDAYRERYNDPVAFPGNTWTTRDSDREVHDRIDIIYHVPHPGFRLQDVLLVGGQDNAADIAIAEYPSDHFGVMAVYRY